MTRFRYIQNSLTSGQFSPLLSWQSNFDKYKNAAKTIENFTIVPQGGVTRRPGSIFVSEVKDSSKATRLIDFEFSTTQAYVLELGDQYMRVYKDSGLVLESDLVVTGITAANPAVVTVSGTAPADGAQIYITEVIGMTEINNSTLYYTVANRTATTFEVQDRDGNNIDSSAFTTYTSAGVVNTIYEVATDWLEEDLFDLKVAQSADVMTVVHTGYAPRDITRTSDTSWTVTPRMKDSLDTSTAALITDGPYLPVNTTTTTITPSGSSGSVTLTASSIVGINDDTGFQTTDIGRLIRYDGTSDVFYDLEVTARTSTTVVTVTVLRGETLNFVGGRLNWSLGSWSDTTGFPGAVTYHQQRQVFAGTLSQPDTFWGSAIQGFFTFEPGVGDDDSYDYTLSSAKVNAIYWLSSSTRLRLGTEGGVWSAWGGSDVVSITPTNINADQENTVRCKNISPESLEGVTLFPQSSGKRLRELAFSFQANRLVSTDITILSEDVLGDRGDSTDTGITQTAYQQEPDATVWCTTSSGSLAALTYLRDEGVVGWTSHSLGGTSATVESVATSPISAQDRVWVIAKRIIDGVTRRYVEQLDTYFRGRAIRQAKFSDSLIIDEGEELAATLTPGATTGTAVIFTAGSSVFTSTDVGRVVESGDGKGQITTYTSGTEVTVQISLDFASTSTIAAGDWSISQDTITGLDHLEGETVSILANGGSHPDRTVADGSIILDAQYNTVVVGLGYASELELLDIDTGSAFGTGLGSKAKINEVTLDLFETSGGTYGAESDRQTALVFRQGNDLMDEGVPLFTGKKAVRPKGGWKDSIKIIVRQTDPLPMTLLAILLKGELNDETG